MKDRNQNSSDGALADDVLLLTVPQVCRILGQGRTKVFEMISTKELKAVKLGRSTRIKRKSVMRVAKNGTGGKR